MGPVTLPCGMHKIISCPKWENKISIWFNFQKTFRAGGSGCAIKPLGFPATILWTFQLDKYNKSGFGGFQTKFKTFLCSSGFDGC